MSVANLSVVSTTLRTQEDLNKDINTCPVCKSDRFLNPNLKLLVSPCFHKVCESCINRIFTQGPARCPLCQNVLRKQSFVEQTFEDLYVEKEVQIRKRIARTYNKRLDDFGNDVRAYNDYLENVERMLFNLLNGVDVAATQEAIAKYERENKDLIKANIQRQLIEDKVTFSKFEKEKRERQMRKEAWQNAMIEEAKLKKNARNEIIRQISANPGILDDVDSRGKSGKLSDLVAKTKAIKFDLATLLENQLKKHPNSRLTEDFDDVFGDDSLVAGTTKRTEPVSYLGCPAPMDFDYKPDTMPMVMDNYIDPWLMPLKLEVPANKQRLDGLGFAPSFVFEKAIRLAYDSLLADI